MKLALEELCLSHNCILPIGKTNDRKGKQMKIYTPQNTLREVGY